jgi:hypothetical protein
MAMDYLPIQATSVPCERVFSSAKETDTARRNRISPVLMESLQLLKFMLKKRRLDFMNGWVTTVKELEKEPPKDGDLGTLFTGNSQIAMDRILLGFEDYD